MITLKNLSKNQKTNSKIQLNLLGLCKIHSLRTSMSNTTSNYLLTKREREFIIDVLQSYLMIFHFFLPFKV